MPKIGRNDPCPCGSGKKFKKCHGGIEHLDRAYDAFASVSQVRSRQEAMEFQRKEQQGLGRPIIATRTISGVQLVAVRNRLLSSKKWATFHDFLGDYIKQAVGPEWGNAELQKPLDERHPILVWYGKLCEQQQIFVKEAGKVSNIPMTGAVAAYMNLAYDLYALDHNEALQEKLLRRLRNKKAFAGARYEIQVAAILLRAGFTLNFENEDDRSTSHCEFTATSIITGKKFSVEAKRAESGRIPRQLVRALKKFANHTRVIFIDLNTPDQTDDNQIPPYLQRAFDLLRRFEAVDPEAKRLPPAYVVLTNSPWEHDLDKPGIRRLGLGDSFHIDDFKLDYVYKSVRSAIDSRHAHIEMHNLLLSMKNHSEIPATFDGQSPDLVFSATERRLVIGNRYKVPGPDGPEIEAVLGSATVNERERVAACAFNTDRGEAFIAMIPLSDEEMQAWKRHPTTFFGEVSGNRVANSPVDLYDFFLQNSLRTSKEKLLEFLGEAPDIEYLKTMAHAEVASIYSERLATSAALNMGEPAPSPLQTKWRARSAAKAPDKTE